MRATTTDRKNLSVYASIEDDDPSTLHVILINKNRGGPFQAQLDIQSSVSYTSVEAWSFDDESAPVTEVDSVGSKVDLSENSFSYAIPSMTATPTSSCGRTEQVPRSP